MNAAHQFKRCQLSTVKPDVMKLQNAVDKKQNCDVTVINALNIAMIVHVIVIVDIKQSFLTTRKYTDISMLK